MTFLIFPAGIGNKGFRPHLFESETECGGAEMRISLADSLRHGFKKWSDAQDAKSPPTLAVHVAEMNERRLPGAGATDGRPGDADR